MKPTAPSPATRRITPPVRPPRVASAEPSFADPRDIPDGRDLRDTRDSWPVPRSAPTADAPATTTDAGTPRHAQGVPRQRLPRHVGLIPDGNRRWAARAGLAREDGYARGLAPGFALFEQCQRLGIDEVSVYGFTQDNTRRLPAQTERFRAACVAFAESIADRGAALLVLGDETSPQFPSALRRFRERTGDGLKVNLLVNYGWQWDLDGLREGRLRSADVSRLDLIVRWGGARRLSGFLPVQSVYADFYVVEDYWPDFRATQFDDALRWYARQDRTLGG